MEALAPIGLAGGGGIFSVCLAGVQQLLATVTGSVLLGYLFPGPLAREQAFDFVLSVPFGIAKFLDSPALSLGHMRQKEHPGSSFCVIPWIPRSQSIAFFSPHFRVFLCLFYI